MWDNSVFDINVLVIAPKLQLLYILLVVKNSSSPNYAICLGHKSQFCHGHKSQRSLYTLKLWEEEEYVSVPEIKMFQIVLFRSAIMYCTYMYLWV